MKKLIKNYIENKEEWIIESAKEYKEEHPDTEIRIATGNYNGNNEGKYYYYYNPTTEDITEGAGFPSGNSSNYSYRNIGDIEISITYSPGYEDYDYIQIERIIRPEDEDMAYTDDWEKPKFPKVNHEDKFKLKDYRSEYPGATITTCINCGEQYIVSQEDVEDGLYTELADPQYNSESKCICSKCTDNMTVEKFLDTIEDEEKREDYHEYMIDWIGMGLDWNLFA